MNKQKQDLAQKFEHIKSNNLFGNSKDELKLLNLIDEAKNIAEKEIEFAATILLAWSNYIRGETKSAFSIYEKLEQKAQKEGDYRTLARIYSNRTSIYTNEGKYHIAISELFKSLKIFSDLDEKKFRGITLERIGIIYRDLKNYDKSEIYLLESSEINQSFERENRVQHIYANLGWLYLSKGDLVKASKYALTGIEEAEFANNHSVICFANLVMGKILNKKENYEKALMYMNRSIDYAKKTGLTPHYHNGLVAKANVLVKMKNYKEAKELLLLLKDNINDNDLEIQLYEDLYTIYKKEASFEEALICYEKLIVHKENLEGINTQNHLSSLEAKYQNELKEKEKEILRLQKVEMEQKALRAQLNPHFFFNSLNSINKFIVDNDAENASKFLFQFSSLMRKTLENSEESFITIEDEVEYLKDYLSLEQLRFNFSFQFEIKVDEEIEDDFVKIPTMMLQPYVENCIKHGVNGIENGLISIEFKMKNDNSILCIIEDNGKGRGSSKSKHKSMGSSILDARIKVLNENNKLKYNASIIDLKQQNNISIGTRVELLMPEVKK